MYVYIYIYIYICIYVYIYIYIYIYIYRSCMRAIYLAVSHKETPEEKGNDTAVRYTRLSLSDEASADRRAIDRGSKRGMIKPPRRNVYSPSASNITPSPRERRFTAPHYLFLPDAIFRYFSQRNRGPPPRRRAREGGEERRRAERALTPNPESVYAA